MSIIFGLLGLVVGFIVGLLVGRKNPKVAERVSLAVDEAKTKLKDKVD